MEQCQWRSASKEVYNRGAGGSGALYVQCAHKWALSRQGTSCSQM